MLTIRQATLNDDTVIKRLIRAARLDPTSLKWQNFLIAELDGTLAGIGQVKQYPGCNELGSLVVLKPYRKQGIAARLIAELEARHPGTMYLLCASKLENFYRQFGYETISWFEAPRFLQLKTSFTLPFRLFGVRVLIMRKG